MIAYHYLEDNWQFRAINSLDDGFKTFDGISPCVFYFDDFLGRVELDRQSLLRHDSALAMFANKIRHSENSRFILTTRAHIFEEARLFSDYMDDKKLNLSKYVLNMNVYNRRIRAQILFNHLYNSDLTQSHYTALLKGDWLKKIIDHKNYNPRVIAAVSSDCFEEIKSTSYPQYIYTSLENPDRIWSTPFRALSMRCRNLLVALYFCSESGENIETLREVFTSLHNIASSSHRQPTMPNDFEDSLHMLESGFVAISGKKVTLVNPSLRDFLKAYLIDSEFLKLLPPSARRSDWSARLWKHCKNLFTAHPQRLSELAALFGSFAQIIDQTPSVVHGGDRSAGSHSSPDLALSQRVELLLEWWQHTEDDLFLQSALDLLQGSSLGLVSWRDGPHTSGPSLDGQ